MGRRRAGERRAPVAGLRYFNVYGPGEAHKGRMASVVHHFDPQLRDTGASRLFGGSHGYGDGEHRRDFVFVGDVVGSISGLPTAAERRGVHNVGTGQSRSFNDVARAVIGWHGRGAIEYIPMPDDLAAAYQAFTEADITRLRRDGYEGRLRVGRGRGTGDARRIEGCRPGRSEAESRDLRAE